MIGFKELKQAQPERFAAAGRAWQQWADKLDEGGNHVRKRIIDAVFGGDVWDDKAADAGRDYTEGLMRGFGTSYDDLEVSATALTTAARKIGDAKYKLEKSENRALEGGLNVDGEGRVSAPTGDYTKKQADALSALIYDCALGINEAIADARRANDDLVGELREHAMPLPTLKQLNASADRLGHQGLEAAKAAKQLLAQGVANLSRDELQRLHNLMRNADDPAFSTQFMEALGPEAALRLNVLFAKAGGSEQAGFFGLGKGLQEDLAEALASATDKTAGHHVSYVPHTAREQADDTSWIDQLKEAGRSSFGTAGRESRLDMFGLTGYHSLAALLDDAKFSSEFLNEVGRDMYKYDVTENPQDWAHDAMPLGGFDLDLGDPNEYGFDPMSGLMEGLANNPEAAQDFFSHDFNDLPKDAQDPVDYLLTGRDWGDGDTIPGTSNLGDALESATTTVRNQPAAEIMGQAVHYLGDDPGSMPANMRDSFGTMISTWIDDVHSAVGTADGTLESGQDGFALDQAGDDPAIPGLQGAHVAFNKEQLLRVMSEAAKDPGAYQEMWGAEQRYAALLLDHEAGQVDELRRDPDVDDPLGQFKSAAETSGRVFGVLMEANGAAAEQLAQSQNATLGIGGDTAKLGISALGAAAGTALGGPAGAMAGAAAAGGAAAAVDEVIQNAQDHNMNATEQEIARMYGDGKYNVAQLVEDAMWRNGLEAPNVPARLCYPNGEPIPYSEMTEDQRDYYRNTWTEDHGGGIDHIKNITAKSVAGGRQDQQDTTDPLGQGG